MADRDSESTQLQGFIDTLVEFVETHNERPVDESVWAQIVGLDALIGHRCNQLGIKIPSLDDVTDPAILRFGFTKILYRKLPSGTKGVFASENWLQSMRALRLSAYKTEPLRTDNREKI